jgi:mannose-1-phosphate guanylyltransferase
MKFILLSGGSGKRLWPLSNDSRSKQFLKVLKNESANYESMVQRVWRQLSISNLVNDSIIATSKSQVDIIKSQLGQDVPIVIEPQRRDTFPAIALASSFLYSEKGCNKNEIVCILPVDSFVENQFFLRVKELDKVLKESNADIALMGVNPTFPSEKYGYIVPKRINKNKFLIVDSFFEKPDEITARELIQKNALWNCGVFAFKLQYILQLLQEKGYPLNYNELVKQYDTLPKNSFDYEVVEKARHVVVIPYNGYWKDLGTWNTLTDAMSRNVIGYGIIEESLKNSHIINELDIPITLLGIDNVVVAASPDGILVTHKDSSPKVKDYVNNINGRPMYEERRWGWYKVLDYTKYPEGNEVLTKRIGINAGQSLSYQMHYKRSEVWTIVKGEGVFVLNDQLHHVRAGEVIVIPLASKHAIRATTDMEIIEVQTGSELIEEDIIRISLDWDEIITNIQVK